MLFLLATLACDDSTPIDSCPEVHEDSGLDDTGEPCEELVWYLDADGDGAGDKDFTMLSCEPTEGFVGQPGDCDDLDATVHPMGSEVCDGLDNDCDGEVDEEASDALTFYADADGDGYGSDADTTTACELPEGYLKDNSDCDDSDPWVSPEGEEVCDSIDNDCDGSVDFDGWMGAIPSSAPRPPGALALRAWS